MLLYGRHEKRVAKNNNELARFEHCVLPHLDAAFNLARWLVGNDHDAQDLAQESCVRALKYFDSFHGTDARAWLLTIVRNTTFTWLRQHRMQALTITIEDDYFDSAAAASDASGLSSPNPETQLVQQADADQLRQAIERLPVEFREVMVLRELEELPYKQIATITGTPVGTVMSRLARARKRLQQILTPCAAAPEDATDGL